MVQHVGALQGIQDILKKRQTTVARVHNMLSEETQSKQEYDDESDSD